jgi:TatD DNase family protein
MLIDTHCHLTYDDLAVQVDPVLRRAQEAGVGRVIAIAETVADAGAALALMESRPQVLLVAGTHPHKAGQVTLDELDALADLHHGRWGSDGPLKRLVAVGETGLDLHYDFATPRQQESVFRSQLDLACATNRPVVVHAREAEDRVCDILADYPGLTDRVVFHCFSGAPDLARRILDMGFWLSFTGVVTFKNADATRSAARMTPDDRLLIETDAPFLSPEPVRKQRPCEPAFVAHTARFLAELRGVSFETLAATTTANAQRFFNLPALDGASSRQGPEG